MIKTSFVIHIHTHTYSCSHYADSVPLYILWPCNTSTIPNVLPECRNSVLKAVGPHSHVHGKKEIRQLISTAFSNRGQMTRKYFKGISFNLFSFSRWSEEGRLLILLSSILSPRALLVWFWVCVCGSLYAYKRNEWLILQCTLSSYNHISWNLTLEQSSKTNLEHMES